MIVYIAGDVTLFNKKTLELMKNNIIIKKEPWVNYLYTNCYSYALNLDIPYYAYNSWKENQINPYNVGTISDKLKMIQTNDELYDAFMSDCKLLNIEVLEVDPEYNKLLDDEWLVALYNQIGYDISDFHFIKKDCYRNWFGKDGYTFNISNEDHFENVIINPKKAKFGDAQDGLYEYIGTYKLKKLVR